MHLNLLNFVKHNMSALIDYEYPVWHKIHIFTHTFDSQWLVEQKYKMETYFKG